MIFKDGDQIFTSSGYERRDTAPVDITPITTTGLGRAERQIDSRHLWFMSMISAKEEEQSSPD